MPSKSNKLKIEDKLWEAVEKFTRCHGRFLVSKRRFRFDLSKDAIDTVIEQV